MEAARPAEHSAYRNVDVINMAITIGAIYASFTVALALSSSPMLVPGSQLSDLSLEVKFQQFCLDLTAFGTALGLCQIIGVTLTVLKNWDGAESRPKFNDRLVEALHTCFIMVTSAAAIRGIILYINRNYVLCLGLFAAVLVFRRWKKGFSISDLKTELISRFVLYRVY